MALSSEEIAHANGAADRICDALMVLEAYRQTLSGLAHQSTRLRRDGAQKSSHAVGASGDGEEGWRRRVEEGARRGRSTCGRGAVGVCSAVQARRAGLFVPRPLLEMTRPNMSRFSTTFASVGTGLGASGFGTGFTAGGAAGLGDEPNSEEVPPPCVP